MSGQLYLLPCPISEAPALDALPASTVETARRIDHFLVEAARTARATLKAMGHPKPIAELDIVEIGHDPAPELISEWLQPVLDGADAAVLSESGCPGVADPGAQIAARAHELGIRVVPLTGPSSILLTLMASGLDGQRFRFSGYLPKHDAALPFWLPKKRAAQAKHSSLSKHRTATLRSSMRSLKHWRPTHGSR